MQSRVGNMSGFAQETIAAQLLRPGPRCPGSCCRRRDRVTDGRRELDNVRLVFFDVPSLVRERRLVGRIKVSTGSSSG